MSLNILSYPLAPSQYVRRKTAKTHIVWHGTMGRTSCTPHNGRPGRATTSIDGWNSDAIGPVGAHYLIDRDGVIYRCFDEDYWIYHLGLKNTNGRYDKMSIGIELANELHLLKDDGKLYAFDRIHRNSEYIGPSFYRDWRHATNWARLDETQIDAAVALTLDIAERHGIAPVFYKPSTLLDYPACFDHATVLCHSNCRQDKKDLLLEDWIWSKIEAAGIGVYEKCG